MMYVDFVAGNNQYKLRLNVRNTVALERQLGKNPLMIFGDGDTIPTVNTMCIILHAALQQYQHGITLDKAYDIFEAWLNDGHTAVDFLPIIIDIYKESGIIGKEENEKN